LTTAIDLLTGPRTYEYFAGLPHPSGMSVVYVVSLIAGTGLFLLEGWAKVLVFLQVGLLLLYRLLDLTLFMPEQKQISEVILRHHKVFVDVGLTDLATHEQIRQGMQTLHAVQPWIRILISLAWGSFVIWFFRRPSVKAQFVSGRQ
jgi:hypothetical protein